MKQFTKTFALLTILSLPLLTQAQFSDDFNDGDLAGWSGDITSFIANGTGQLQLQGDCAAGGENYISAAVSTADTATWEFYAELGFDPSSSNYTKIYLQSTNADLTGTLNGYFVRIGEDGTSDAVKLYRQDGDIFVLILTGTLAEVATSPIVRIKVSRSTAGLWDLQVDPTGGVSFVSEGTVTDNTYTSGSYFGMYAKYTSTRCNAFYFDDVNVGPIYVDNDAPVITGIDVVSSTQIDVHFNENVTAATAEAESNYTVDHAVGAPINAALDAADHTRVSLTFITDFPEAVTLTLTAHGIQDENGNAITLDDATFSYYTIHQYDVVINEIYADIDPQVALPMGEYVELYNTTDLDIDISGFTMADATSVSDPFGNYLLPANGYVILCDVAVEDLFAAYPNVLGVATFPALNNDGDDLQLFDAAGNLLHRANYTTDWYDNTIKQSGGWSLEMIDPANPCQGDDNWTASEDASGGTPGTVNSVLASNPDELAPGLLNAYPIDVDTVIVYFDEPLEMNSVAAGDFMIDNGIGTPSGINVNADIPDQVQLILSASLTGGIVYTLTVNGVSDCTGNTIGLLNTTQFGLPEPAAANDVVLNEILFNPVSSGFDYVEIYNRSNKIIDLSQLIIAELDLSDTTQVAEFGNISNTGRLFFPGQYMCITLNIGQVTSQYFTIDTGNFIIPADMPNFSDDEGIAVLYDLSLNTIDELHFLNDWHYALLNDENGVSLERVNYDYTTQDANNWHSAAADVHFGTPGYQNSDFGTVGTTATVDLGYNVFSPDGDGYHDLLLINYSTAADGYNGTFKIFDAQGKFVKDLALNYTLSREGFITWDGIDEEGNAAAMGIYILYTEFFDVNGAIEKHKMKFTLVRKQ